jgi:hypothetical protein
MLAQLAEQLRTAGEASTSAEVGPCSNHQQRTNDTSREEQQDDARIT